MVLVNKGLKVLILLIIIALIIVCYYQYKSLVEIREKLGLQYYGVISHIDFYLGSHQKAFDERFNTLENIDIERYRVTINEYIQIQNILPNNATYDRIFFRLAHNLHNLSGVDDLSIGIKAKIRNHILKDFRTLTDIYDLMAEEYDGNNLRYYKVLNDSNSKLNEEIDVYVNKWFDEYEQGLNFDYETIDSILKDNERISNITWSHDKQMVLFIENDSIGCKAYLWRVGEESENFISELSIDNYGFSWSSNSKYFLINEGRILSNGEKSVISTIISSENLSAQKYKLNCTSKPVWSPVDNKLVVSTSDTDKKTYWDTLRIYDLDNNTSHVIAKSYNSSYEPYYWNQEGIIGYYEIDNKTGARIEKAYEFDFSLQ